MMHALYLLPKCSVAVVAASSNASPDLAAINVTADYCAVASNVTVAH